jgi:uracil-DNA glycosylase
LKLSHYPFRHHAAHALAVPGGARDVRLYDSYHCSRYNTHTRRLTADMFEAVFRDIRVFLSSRQ